MSYALVQPYAVKELEASDDAMRGVRRKVVCDTESEEARPV